MAYTPSDIYRVIEPLIINQGFGENPASYKRFGLAGHNGWDYKTKILEDIVLANGRAVKATPTGKRALISPWFSSLYKIGFDADGFGNYFEVLIQLYSLWKVTYAHCTTIKDQKQFSEAEEMAVSGSTGNSTGDHVHETVKRIQIVNGAHQVLNYNNGYFGAVNNQEFYDELRKYKKEFGNIPSPVVVSPEGGNMDMYRGLDLDNKPSMRVAVDSHLRVVNREVIPVSEVNSQIDALKQQFETDKKAAIEQAKKEGIEIGKQQVIVPAPQPSQPSSVDLSGWVENGLTTETTVGNTKVIRNYKQK